MHYAGFHNRGNVVRLLVKWDSDENELIKAKNSQGKTPVVLTSKPRIVKAFDSNI